MTTEAAVPSFAYVGVAPCGCIQAATVDTPDHAKDIRRDVREMMKWGHVERLPVEQVRKRFCLERHPKSVCPHPQACPQRAMS